MSWIKYFSLLFFVFVSLKKGFVLSRKKIRSNKPIIVFVLIQFFKENSLYAWGDNTYGQVGDGTTTQRDSPVSVSGGLSTVTQVNTGVYHCLALLGILYSFDVF